MQQEQSYTASRSNSQVIAHKVMDSAESILSLVTNLSPLCLASHATKYLQRSHTNVNNNALCTQYIKVRVGQLDLEHMHA